MEQNIQSAIVNLESSILNFIDQYKGTDGRLKELVGNSINTHYTIYADFINMYNDLLLPNYYKISKFMLDEFKRNDVIVDEETK